MKIKKIVAVFSAAAVMTTSAGGLPLGNYKLLDNVVTASAEVEQYTISVRFTPSGDSLNWDKVYCHYLENDDDGNLINGHTTAWPGIEMTKDGNDWILIATSEWFPTEIIFDNGASFENGGMQTIDLPFYYINGDALFYNEINNEHGTFGKYTASAAPVEPEPIDDVIISQGKFIRMGSYKGEDVDWFCYRINSTGVMMLSKYVLKNSSFGSNSTYTESNIYKWLDSDANGTFESELGLTSAEKSIVRTVDLSSTKGDGTDRFIIPAYGNSELDKGALNPITQYISNKDLTADIVWLRTPRDSTDARVVRSGDVNVVARYSGVTYGRGVRPMFYLDTDALKNLAVTGSGTEDDPYILEERYNIGTNISPTGGGTVSATAIRNDTAIYSGELPNKLVAGATVTLTVKPNTGYDLASINIDNGTVDITENQDGTYSFVMPQNDIVISAVFTKQKFTVKWNNYDGSTLETDEDVEYGTTPTYNSETPKKPYDGQHYYLFDKWSPTINPVNANITYTAQFVTNDPAYTVTIPATVDLGGAPATVSIDSMENIPLGKSVRVAIDGDADGNFTVEQADDKLSYTITGTRPSFYYAASDDTTQLDIEDDMEILHVEGPSDTGNPRYIELKFNEPDQEPKYAGDYTGTVTFNVSIS
ncbi:starch-binding protein [uncultured Ruminococcus sp.]|uniref:starch-binding protein n=1 Tax=uncultured Ruminococcus sp. TaxID=165186 RepID=UPI0025FAF263|nr:starch-binding protein [uncultured Ruminococcus sp.]